MRGGKRSGAGRRKGAPNKATAARQAEISASGEAPLDYMIRVMRDEGAPVERRDEMARAAAPYVHPRLAAVDHSGSIENVHYAISEQPLTEDEWAEQYTKPH